MATLFQPGLLLAGIEPAQEAAPAGLDQAVVGGPNILQRGMPCFQPQTNLTGPSRTVCQNVPHTESPRKQMSIARSDQRHDLHRLCADDQATLNPHRS